MPQTKHIYVYTNNPAQNLVYADGEGTMGVGAIGTAITGLTNGTLQAGQHIVVGTQYGVCVGAKTPTNPVTVMQCTQATGGTYNLST